MLPGGWRRMPSSAIATGIHGGWTASGLLSGLNGVTSFSGECVVRSIFA